MKKLSKRLFKSKSFQIILCWLIANYIRLVYYTSKKIIDIDEKSKIYIEGKKPAILAFWHGRLLMMPTICPPNRKINVMISSHSDGAIISQAMTHFGFTTISGSSTRGGISATRNSIKSLNLNEFVAITPDGPRGPAMKVQKGTTMIARVANMPILPVSYSSTKRKNMRSWDKFLVALPFGTLFYKIGAPIVNGDVTELENQMIKITEEVDRLAVS